MSNGQTDTDNGEPKKLRNGLVELPGSGLREVMTKREQVALRLMQSLVRSCAPAARVKQAGQLATESYTLADAFIAAGADAPTEA